LQASRQESEGLIRGLQKQLTDASEREENARLEIAAVTDKLTAAERAAGAAADAARRKAVEQAEEIARLKSELAETHQSLSAAQSRGTELAAAIEQLKAKKEELSRQVVEAHERGRQAAAAELEKKIKDAEQKMSMTQLTIGNLRATIERQKGELDQAAAAKAAAEKRAEEAERKLAGKGAAATASDSQTWYEAKFNPAPRPPPGQPGG
jgi:chromosome segregation ATPase